MTHDDANLRVRVGRILCAIGASAAIAAVLVPAASCDLAEPLPDREGRLSTPGVSEELGIVSGALTVGGYACPQCCTCKELTLQNIPLDNVYYVTTFTGGGMACGGTASGDWAYIAGSQRWGCGAKVAVKNPANGKQCVTKVADCGPNKCVEQAGGKAIIDASPFITGYLFGITSSGWSEHRKVVATLVDSGTAVGCPGGNTPPPAPTLPVMAISSTTAAKDARPEGKSSGIGDVYEGDTFVVDVLVEAKSSGSSTNGHVQVGYWVETPWLVPVTYTIYTDWPNKDKKTWVVNDADGEKSNPSKTSPPATGKIDIYGMSPGETKKISFKLSAAAYSIGESDHPDLRAWVWHVANYYGEQTGFYDAVETNKAGKELKTYAQQDVYGRTHWEWNGDATESEGWAAANAVAELNVNTEPHCLAVKQGGGDPHIASPALSFEAGAWKGFELRVRQYEGDKGGQLFWKTAGDGAWSESKSAVFMAPGDGEFHKLTINLSGVPTWKGTVTGLRLDPTTESEGWYDIDWLRAVKEPGPTTGDVDGDGVIAGEDCDDGHPGVYPGAPEVCDGIDDDCDGEVDEGMDVGAPCTAGEGPCVTEGVTACNADGTVSCTASAGDGTVEVCNGIDDDCDGQTDEDFGLGQPCEGTGEGCAPTGIMVCTADGQAIVCNAGGGGIESCNGKDDDCDGHTDEGFLVGEPCSVGVGACEEPGIMLCTSFGGSECSALAGNGSVEVCDGIDNDCDGLTDEHMHLPCEDSAGGASDRGDAITSASANGGRILDEPDTLGGVDGQGTSADSGCGAAPGTVPSLSLVVLLAALALLPRRRRG